MTMNNISGYSLKIAAALFSLVIGLTATTVFGQNKAEHKEKNKDFCSENNSWSSDERVSARDLREMTVASVGELKVDGDRNGGISVKGEDRRDVLVRACVQAWAKSDEAAKANVAAVRINTTGTIKAENTGGENWSVSYDIRVPRNSNLTLSAHNGGISISGVDGTLGFETTNGGVFLSDVAGAVKGRTTNGGVFVKLDGTTWKGGGLDVTTTNGGVKIEMPQSYAARIETGTVNGGFNSDIPALNVTTEQIVGDEYGRRHRPTRISTSINGGGPMIRVVTTNGGVKISSPE